ncbi:hypothetical protein CH35J_000239 [Colletotrichum higginsianum]|nr:hypothetical protein CH35J_000239 [Colletotrichum higginsianum]
MKIAVASFLLVGILALLHAAVSRRSSSRREAARRERKHSRRARHRRDHREARNEAFKASLANLWSRMFADRLGPGAGFDEEEKRAFLSGGAHARPSSSSDEGDFETVDSMTSEITEFRNAATLVTEMVAAEERRQRMREQQDQERQRQQQQRLHMPRRGPEAAVSPPSPTAAFAEYMGDDVLPAYDEHAPAVIVSDGFSSYSPGSTEYVPGASSDTTASNIDSVLGDPKN